MKEKSEIGKTIKNIRIKSGLSQCEFAKKIGISQPHLSRVENGYENMSKSAYMLVTFLFNVNGGELRK